MSDEKKTVPNPESEPAVSACCSTSDQETCCAPSAKTDCCGAGGCNC